MAFLLNQKKVFAKCSNKCEKVEEDDLLNEDEKNHKSIVCRRCGSVFFEADMVTLIENKPMQLKKMSVLGKEKLGVEVVTWWWYCDDEFDFDTVGWMAVDGQKVHKKREETWQVLMCGDCEFGPVGLRSADNKQFYLSVERVAYK